MLEEKIQKDGRDEKSIMHTNCKDSGEKQKNKKGNGSFSLFF